MIASTPSGSEQGMAKMEPAGARPHLLLLMAYMPSARVIIPNTKDMMLLMMMTVGSKPPFHPPPMGIVKRMLSPSFTGLSSSFG